MSAGQRGAAAAPRLAPGRASVVEGNGVARFDQSVVGAACSH